MMKIRYTIRSTAVSMIPLALAFSVASKAVTQQNAIDVLSEYKNSARYATINPTDGLTTPPDFASNSFFFNLGHSVEEVRINSPQVDERLLETLRKFPSLKSLCLSASVSDHDYRQLQRSFPELNFKFEGCFCSSGPIDPAIVKEALRQIFKERPYMTTVR